MCDFLFPAPDQLRTSFGQATEPVQWNAKILCSSLVPDLYILRRCMNALLSDCEGKIAVGEYDRSLDAFSAPKVLHYRRFINKNRQDNFVAIK